MVLLESTLLVHVEKEKSLVSQRLTRDFKYPEPGSNRHGLLHWCLRPARLPIPPSGPIADAKISVFSDITNFLTEKFNSIADRRVNQQVQNYFILL